MSLLEQLTQTISQQVANQAAEKTGLDAGTAEKLMPMAMAALMGGIKKNASSTEGVNALSGALQNHDGGILDNLSSLTDDNVMAEGQKMLGHILGGKQGQTQQALAQVSGANSDQIGQLLAMAAPAVLGALGKTQKDQGLDVSALAGLVTQEGQKAQQAMPNELGGLMKMLDQDGDGDFKDDLVQGIGKKLLGGLFGRK